MKRYDYEFSTETLLLFDGVEDVEITGRDCYNIIDWKRGGNHPIACALDRDSAEQIIAALNNVA